MLRIDGYHEIVVADYLEGVKSLAAFDEDVSRKCLDQGVERMTEKLNYPKSFQWDTLIVP